MSLASVPMEDGAFVEELEALKAIYIREMDVSYCPSTDQPLCISINLHPATADNADEQYVCLTLIIKLPLTYPNDLPEISIRNPRGLSDEDLDLITKDLLAKAKQSQGNAMLFELIEMAKEHLTMDNTPRCLCAICLYEFSEQDVFTKTECYHHFHSHCLARYVESLTINAAETEANVNPHAEVVPPAKVLCPVCREPIRGNLDLKAPPPVQSESAAEFQVDEELKRRQETMAATFEKQKSRGGIIDIEAEKNKFLIDISSVPSSNEASDAHVDPLKSSQGATAATSKLNRLPRHQQNGSRNAPILDWSASMSSKQSREDETLANGMSNHHHQKDYEGTSRPEVRRGNSGRSRRGRGGWAARGHPRDYHDGERPRGGQAEGGGAAPSRRGGRGRGGRGTYQSAFPDRSNTADDPPVNSNENCSSVAAAAAALADSHLDASVDVGLNVEKQMQDDNFVPHGDRVERNGWPRGRGSRRSFGSTGENRGGRGNRRRYDDSSTSGNDVPVDEAQSRNRNSYCDNPGRDQTYEEHVDNTNDSDSQRGGGSRRGRRPLRHSFRGDRRGSADNSSARPQRSDVADDGDWAGGHHQDGPRVNSRRYWTGNRNSERGGSVGLRDNGSLPADGAEVDSAKMSDRYQRDGGGGRGRQRPLRSGRGWGSRRNTASGHEDASVVSKSYSESSADGVAQSQSSPVLSGAPTLADIGGVQESRRMVLTGPPTKASFGKSRPGQESPTLTATHQRGDSHHHHAAAPSRVHRDAPAPRLTKEHRRMPPDVTFPPPGFQTPMSSNLKSMVSATASMTVSGPPPGFGFQTSN